MLRWNLAGLALLAGATLVQADDVIRLGGTFSADDDTHLVHRRGYGGGGYYGHRGYGWGGYGHRHSYYGGYGHRGYGWGGYGYRHSYYGGWGGYHRPYYSSFYHRPYYSSFYHRPYYSYGYRPHFYSSYYYLPYYYSSPAYYFIDPCADELPAMPEATTLGSSSFAPRRERAEQLMPPVDQGNGTYRYDGGPRQAVPMPDTGPASKPASPPLPRDFKLVTQPATPQYTYAAYGETTPRTATPATTRFVSEEAPLPPARLTYAAYGSR